MMRTNWVTRVAAWLLLGGQMTAAIAHDVIPYEGVTSSRVTISSDYLSRQVVVLKPGAALAAKAPAIILLHYLFGTTQDMADLVAAGRLARDAGVWVILPQGQEGHWNYSLLSGKSVDDVKFLNAVIDDALARYPIDPKRIYMAGYSDGGLMAQRYACEMPQRIAGIASVAQTLDSAEQLACAPAIGTPALFINGTADPVIPYAGSGLTLSPAAATALWRRFDGCTDAATETALPDTVDDGSSALRRSWRGCANGLGVDQIIVQGGGHTWPGSTIYSSALGTVNQDFSATDALWQFFRNFSR